MRASLAAPAYPGLKLLDKNGAFLFPVRQAPHGKILLTRALAKWLLSRSNLIVWQILAKKRPVEPEPEDTERRWPRPRTIVFGCAYLALAGAVAWNALVMQPAGGMGRLLADGATDTSTVVISYDPAVEEVQRELLSIGAYQGLVDGIYGERTRQAILAYQKSNDLVADGKVSQALVEQIRYDRTLAAAAEYTASTVKPAASSNRRLLRVEQALSDLGYDPGDVDGRLTGETKAAIRVFEADRKLPPTGEVSSAVLAELAKTTGYENIASQ